MSSGVDAPNCVVWVAKTADYRSRHEELLDDVERLRATAFRQPASRARFVVGAVLLKMAVADRTGRGVAAVHVDRRCPECEEQHGRPTIPGSDLEVSVSHSGSLVLVGVTRIGRVGVDVEDRTIRRVMPPAERFLVDAEPVGRPDDLLTYWCRKESVVKAVGQGAHVSPRDVVVSPAGEPPRLVTFQGNVLDATMADLSVGEGYAAALTVLTAERLVIEILVADVLP